MAKWVSPREQRERETARLIAQYRPVAEAAAEALTHDWQAVPEGASNLIYRAVKTALDEAGLVSTYAQSEAGYAALVTLQDECAKPFVAKYLAQKRATEKAAAAQVDRNRPVVARCDGAMRVGELVILRDGDSRRVLVCIGIGRDQDDELGDTEWYSELAEPNEAEKASADYQRMTAEAQTEAKRVAAERARIAARRQAELDAIRAEGREPTFLEQMFAGTSDD